MRKKLAILLSAVMAIGVLATSPVSFSSTAVYAEEEQTAKFSNPVYNAETDTTDWDYAYYGTYPKTELTGAALTADIVNAEYDDDNVAVVDGVKYYRMTQRDATANSVGNGVLKGLEYTAEAFYQWSDSKSYHYFKYEPIRWRILEVSGESVLLMADNAIDCQRYSTNTEKYTWAGSPMRMWLNGHSEKADNGATYAGDGFFQNAFTKEEQADVILSDIHTEDNNLWGNTVPGGKDVQDYVFLLSIEETMNQDYGFAPDAMTLSSTRRIQPTDYAFAMGTWLATYGEYYGNCWWMLRSSGDYAQKMGLVYRTGQVYKEGYYVNTAYYGVVPAMRVKIDAKNLMTEEEYKEKYPQAGEVVYGDTNLDGDVNLDDTLLTLKIALGIVVLTDDVKAVADVDGDGEVNLDDVLYILKYSLGVIDEFPVEIEEKPVISYNEAPKEAEETQEPGCTTTAPVITTPPASGRVWLAADSIAAQHDNSTNLAASSLTVKTRDTLGWGVIFNNYFKDANYRRFEDGNLIDTQFAKNTDDSTVVINNTALSSRSSKSFTQEANYETLISNIGAGDYLFISFGHNDEYPQVERYTDPYGDSTTVGSYKWYLVNKFIEPALQANATPVLVSSVVKRNYIDGEYQPQFHEAYATAMKELSEEYAAKGITIPYIDLHHKMDALYSTLTDEQSKLLHASYSVAEFNEGGQGEIIRLLVGDKQDGELDSDRENAAREKIRLYTVEEVNALVEEAAKGTNVDGVSYINAETSGSHMDDVHFTYAGAKYAAKFILEGIKELKLDLYDLADEEAISTLDEIVPVEQFKESEIYKNVH